MTTPIYHTCCARNTGTAREAPSRAGLALRGQWNVGGWATFEVIGVEARSDGGHHDHYDLLCHVFSLVRRTQERGYPNQRAVSMFTAYFCPRTLLFQPVHNPQRPSRTKHSTEETWLLPVQQPLRRLGAECDHNSYTPFLSPRQLLCPLSNSHPRRSLSP
jgi:hypothetical protein